MLARKVFEAIYLERVKEAFITWRCEVMGNSWSVLSRLVKQKIRSNVYAAFVLWMRFTKAHFKWDFSMLLLDKMCSAWATRVNAGVSARLRGSLNAWIRYAGSAKAIEESKRLNTRSLKLLIRSRVKTITMEKLRWGWANWSKVVDQLRKAALEKKIKTHEEEEKSKLLKTLMRHRLFALYLSQLRSAMKAWLRYTSVRKNDEEEDISKQSRLRRFVGAKIRAFEVDGTRHGFAAWLRFTFEKRKDELIKERVDLESFDSQRTLKMVMRHRIAGMVTEHLRAALSIWVKEAAARKLEVEDEVATKKALKDTIRRRVRDVLFGQLRWAWKKWERFASAAGRDELAKLGANSEKYVRDKSAQIFLRQRVRAVYTAHTKLAFSEWVRFSLDSRMAAERQARDEDRLRFIVRSRISKMILDALRASWMSWLKTVYELQKSELTKQREEHGEEMRTRALKVHVKHRFHIMYISYLNSALSLWLRFVKEMRTAERDAESMMLEEEKQTFAFRSIMRNRCNEIYEYNLRRGFSAVLGQKRTSDTLRGIVRRRIREVTHRELRWGMLKWTKVVYEMRRADIIREREEDEVKSNSRTLHILIRHRINALYFDNLETGFTKWVSYVDAMKRKETESKMAEAKRKDLDRRRFILLRRVVSSKFDKLGRISFTNWFKFTLTARRAAEEAMADTKALKSLVRRRVLALYNEAIRDSFLKWVKLTERNRLQEIQIIADASIKSKAAKIIMVQALRFWRRKLSRGFAMWVRYNNALISSPLSPRRLARRISSFSSRRLSQEDIFFASGKLKEELGVKTTRRRKMLRAVSVLAVLVLLLSGAYLLNWRSNLTARHEGSEDVAEPNAETPPQASTANSSNAGEVNEGVVPEIEREEEVRQAQKKKAKDRRRRKKYQDLTRKDHFAMEEEDWIRIFKLA